MVTPNEDQVTIRTREQGAELVTRRLRGVAGAVRGVGGAARSTYSSLIGANLLTGILGGTLVGLALNSAGASNGMLRLRSSLEGLLDPFVQIGARTAEWFAEQNNLTQYGILAGAAALYLFRNRITSLIGQGISKLITKLGEVPWRKFADDITLRVWYALEGVVERINNIINRLKALIAEAGKAGKEVLEEVDGNAARTAGRAGGTGAGAGFGSRLASTVSRVLRPVARVAGPLGLSAEAGLITAEEQKRRREAGLPGVFQPQGFRLPDAPLAGLLSALNDFARPYGAPSRFVDEQVDRGLRGVTNNYFGVDKEAVRSTIRDAINFEIPYLNRNDGGF